MKPRISIYRGNYGDPKNGTPQLCVSRGLKSGKVDVFDLDRATLLDLADDAIKAVKLEIERDQGT